MKHNNIIVPALLVAVSSFNGNAQSAAADYDVNHSDPRTSRFDYRPGEIIVRLKTSPSAGAPAKLRSANGRISSSSKTLEKFLGDNHIVSAEPLMSLTGGNVSPNRVRSLNGQDVVDNDLSALYALRVDSNASSDLQSLVDRLNELDEVEYAEPNYMVHICSDPASYTTDPLYSQQWGPAAIGVDKLWSVPLMSDDRPVIAIIDTGVDVTHPDLAENIWTNPREADGADGRDDDANGFVDDVHGWDFVNQSPSMRDNNGHGTHCAGIAAAVGGNGIGITGANPDALIMPVAVLQSNGSGDMATIIKGIDYAVANGADVISMSFGSYRNSLALSDALAKAYQHAVLVAAAGNDNLCIYPHKCPYNNYQEGASMFPAAYSFVFGVEASGDENGMLTLFSNYDEDGPITTFDPNLNNYELRAPGVNVLSTFPGGQYKVLNGTSMATPLVAGAISRLMSCRDVAGNEELLGDLIATAHGNIDIFSAYNIKDTDRRPSLSLVTYRFDDEKMGDGDGRPDAGETIRIYPTFRNTWGNARNITYSIRLHELEDPSVAEFLDPEGTHFLSNLSSYASAEAGNPFVVKISPDCVDGRIIRFVVEATCDNISEPMAQEITMVIENGVEIGGVISQDMTLTPDKNYIVTATLAVPRGVTLTILPGTTIKFRSKTGIIVDGVLLANGRPDNRIIFTKADKESWLEEMYFNLGNNISYCDFVDLPGGITLLEGSYVANCLFSNIGSVNFHQSMKNCVITNCIFGYWGANVELDRVNFIRNTHNGSSYSIPDHSFPFLSMMSYCNSFGNYFLNALNNYEPTYGSVYVDSDKPALVANNRNYFGSGMKSFLERSILDIYDGGYNSFGEFDYSTVVDRAVNSAPGIVWKVVVNGYDAQDEFDWIAPLGVGRHKFEIYFSRRMNHDKTPMVAMGVRAPYTQTAISEDGSWRTETIDGDQIDIYTVYLTIKGKDNFDGVNTIYVAEAEDDEFFPIPIEDVRFHVNVQSAGAMSAGFAAESGIGRVTLTWENPEENFDDMLGYNLYRYTLDADDIAGDTIRINEKLLDKEMFVDYDIVPGTTYCYYYKVLRTSLDENSPSKVVAATPRAAGKGDANASGAVDVADVVTEVNYMVGQDPKPFMFEAADVNDDSEIDILDVVGTVNIIMKPSTSAAALAVNQSSAVYSVEDGVLYIDSSVDLAGLQVELRGDRGLTDIKVLDALQGMESAGAWINDDDYRFLAFSLSGNALESGRHAVLDLGDAQVGDIILVDTAGNLVVAIVGETCGISSVVGQQIRLPYPNPFDRCLNVPVSIATDGTHDVVVTLTGLTGAALMSQRASLARGEHMLTFDTSRLSKGFYIVTLTVDNRDIQSVKAIKR